VISQSLRFRQHGEAKAPHFLRSKRFDLERKQVPIDTHNRSAIGFEMKIRPIVVDASLEELVKIYHGETHFHYERS
jgi:hypothetical protein